MMSIQYDVVIRGGSVIDGTGMTAREADIAIVGDRIVKVGTVEVLGREEIDASGLLVTPGFVDVHTHYDGQVSWESRLTPSSNHGVTTVVAGNCGVGFAPCRIDDREKLVKLMEGVEDVPEVVMTAGLPWNWETFPQYLDAIAARDLDIDIAFQVPHSALRVYVMGDRGAAREPANADDRAQMSKLVTEAVRAGAIGVSTSRLLAHRSADGTPIPSLDSATEELVALGRGLHEAGTGVFQIVPNYEAAPEGEVAIMRAIVEQSGRPLSFTLTQAPHSPDHWQRYIAEIEKANANGLSIRGQIFPRPVGMMFGLDLSFNPLSRRASWQKIAKLPLADKVAALRNPDFRAQILSEVDAQHPLPAVNIFLERLDRMAALGDPPNYLPGETDLLGHRAAQAEQDLLPFAVDEMLKQEGNAVLYLPAANYSGNNITAARTMMDHPLCVIGLGDGGAHYGMVCDASYPTTILTHWARDVVESDRLPLEKAIAAITSEPAKLVGMHDRGLVAEGCIADINLIDADELRLHAPRVRYDLPAGGRRLTQGASGYCMTMKRGVVIYRDGEPTGALPGRVVRSGEFAAAA
jgi:N-acyl-D-aspartate/D-glutamate deacylase